MDTKLSDFPIPVLNPNIWVTNEFRDKRIHVIISPNEDYLLADIFIGFAGLGTGALGMIKSLSSLELLLRTLSFMRNAKEISDKLKGVLAKSSVAIPPGASVEVYNAFMKDPLMWLKPTGIINLFGGKGFSILITDEDFKNTVMFNTALDKRYFANEQGVRDPMRIWNGGRTNTGLQSHYAPSLVLLNNKMLMLYKDSTGQRIYITEFTEGSFKSIGLGFIPNFTSSTGVSAAVRGDRLVIAARDATGKQMYCLVNDDPDREHQQFLNFSFTWMSQDINDAPAVATRNNDIYAVSTNGGQLDIVWANVTATAHTWGQTLYRSLYTPAIQTFKGEVYMVYVDTLNHNIDLAVHTTAGWRRTMSIGQKTSAGPALVVYKDRLYVIFRDVKGNGIFYVWTDDCKTFKQSPDGIYTGLDGIDTSVAAAPVPGGNKGILISGVIKQSGFMSSSADIVWKILMPYEGNSPRSVIASESPVAEETPTEIIE